MGRVIEKFALYVRHMENIIPETLCSKNRATLKGKLNRLVNTSVALRSAFFTDILAEVKRFSMIKHEKGINVIKILDAVETTKLNYERLKKEIPVGVMYEKIFIQQKRLLPLIIQ